MLLYAHTHTLSHVWPFAHLPMQFALLLPYQEAVFLFLSTSVKLSCLCRLEGLMYATGVAYSEDAGVLLDDNVIDLALAFTDSVPKLTKNMFSFSGPSNITITDLEKVDGSDAYWTFSATFPDTYYGKLTVSMNAVSSCLRADTAVHAHSWLTSVALCCKHFRCVNKRSACIHSPAC